MPERRPARHTSAGGTPGDTAGPIARTLARTIIRGADAATRVATRLLGGESAREGLSGAELRELVSASTALPGEERRIIREVILTGTRHVREVMVPRPDVLFLQAGQTIGAAARMVGAGRHSRFPVVDGSPDEVIGFVHLRDLLTRREEEAVTLGEVAREIKRLPGSKRVLAALSEMRAEGRHLAVVVDEYGGTAGIVTLEDLIEELVGEIHDEYDPTPEPPVEGSVPSHVDGRLNLSDLTEATGLVLPSGPYETLGGYLMARLGRLPAVGDEVLLAGPSGRPPCRLVVTALDGRRVDRVALLFGDGAAEPVPSGGLPGQPVTGRYGTPTQAHVRASRDRPVRSPSAT